LCLLLLLQLTLVAGQAQGGRVLSRLQPTQLAVIAQEARPRFPEAVDFTLKTSGFEATRATLLFRPVGSPITGRLEERLQASTSALDLRVSLDLATASIPPGAQVEYYWSLSGPSGTTADTQRDVFSLIDTRFQWQTISDDERRFSVHWYGGDVNFGKFLFATAAGALDRFRSTLDTRLDKHADIWVYGSEDDLFSAYTQDTPDYIGGQSFPDLGLVLVAIPDDESARSEIKRVVPHELAHILVHQITRNPYNAPPLWLQEGIATHSEETIDPGYDAALRDAAERGDVDPLRALTSSFGQDEEGLVVAYAQSRSVVDFILGNEKYGPERLARTLAAFREGVTYDEALQRGLGVSTDDLDREWRLSLPFPIADPQKPPATDTISGPQTDNTILLVTLGITIGLALAVFTALVILLLLRRRGAGVGSRQ
jgi:hypothetical protein